jgi:hypothetical protein
VKLLSSGVVLIGLRDLLVVSLVASGLLHLFGQTCGGGSLDFVELGDGDVQ